jgi:uncharacterized LabA/DUF88 family protein
VSKNVAVFVDVANIFYAAKAAGADIDYVTLLKAAVAGRDFVRAYAYTGLDPENENQRNFHSFLARHGYKVVSKDIRKYGDGKVKANLDIELVVDMMKTARNLDVAIVVSGDGDFAPAIRAVQEMGVRVEVISFRGNTSSDLIEVADAFYDITQVAKVDRDSSRSGRRVAGDDEDLSMTEVPDKQTEGRGGRRGRGRGRWGRGEGLEDVVVAAAEAPSGRAAGGRGLAPRTATRTVAGSGVAVASAPAASSGGRLIALPGEKLSRAGAAAAGVPVDGELVEEAAYAETGAEIVEIGEDVVDAGDGEGTETGAEGAGRRRRRRGGRGRGHGHSREGIGEGTDGEPTEAVELDEAEAELQPASPAQRPNQFGSVWDSQIGMAGRPERLAPISADDDDFAEPEIPEYLLAERRRGGRSQGGGGRGQGGGRGVRSAYASAVERERYGRGSSSRYPEPVRQPQSQPQSQQPRRRDDRPPRQAQPLPNRGGGAPRSTGRESAEPWTEVPPELEELLRAQLSSKLSRQGAAPAPAQTTPAEPETEIVAVEATEAKPAPRRGRTRKVEPEAAAQSTETGPAAEAPAEKPKPASRSRRKPAAAEGEGATSGVSAAGEATAATESAAPKRRAPARRKTAAPDAAIEGQGGEPAGE